jgi:hypothetical protein
VCKGARASQHSRFPPGWPASCAIRTRRGENGDLYTRDAVRAMKRDKKKKRPRTSETCSLGLRTSLLGGREGGTGGPSAVTMDVSTSKGDAVMMSNLMNVIGAPCRLKEKKKEKKKKRVGVDGNRLRSH